MVTAAVYWGFNSKHTLFLLTFQHWAGVGSYTSSYDFAESCVFIKQSLPPILCHLYPYGYRYSFSRSYGVILPSSFNTVLSNALVYSTSSPVSVYSTVFTLKFFLGKIFSVTFQKAQKY